MWGYLQEKQIVLKRNRVDLYHFGYMIRSKSARKLGTTTAQQIKDITDEIRAFLVKDHRDILSESFMNKEKRAAVEQIIKSFLLSNQVVISEVPSEQLLNMVCDEIVGFGIIEPLKEDKDVTDIYINGTKEIIYEKIGEGECTFPYRFETEEEVKALAYKMVNSTSESLNTAKPYVDCVFPYIRINIALDELGGLGTTITIRKNADHLRASEERMLSTNQASKEMLNFLAAAVKAKMNILVAGATGTGKSEFMKYLASHIPKGKKKERTLVVEDNPELYLHRIFPEHHFVPMQCRASEVEENAIDFDRLLTNALRQGPKRLIVGESRGKEALKMINFFQTGHPGFTSVHARSAKEAVRRLMLMCLQSGANIDAQYLYELISQTFDVIVFLEKKDDGNRYITEMIELLDYQDDIQFNQLSQFIPSGEEYDEMNERVGKIHGDHIITAKMSAEMEKKFRSSTVNPALYAPFLSQQEVQYA
ncbi:Type II secretion system protein [Bacillus thuringiensis serovar pirenaica]|uniref:CpaF family protein n=1 Tax=Bacillus thuringiensis TaxID=1428 RepID=UPI000A3A1215|nr:CpaF/VirB11 family protein [Bacillus thuringiensis]OUB30711.1 Type II secretion system protein [Bacillus thuringiensis serovar pirenaica]